jgi:predicted aminopeptidase
MAACTAACLALLFALPGCSTISYYAQAIGGHLELMRGARTLQDRIADPLTPAPLREKLSQAMAIRQFPVEKLNLPDNGSYRSYADLKRSFVLWNVFAAPEFSVRPVRSCFPFAGCVDYRGWYNEADARSAAEEMRARGNDVYIGGVPAYSTLGWFDDPLLNTFVVYPEAEIARLLFHELAHQVVYVKDDSVFNESFAVAVEEEGMRRWQAGRPDPTAGERTRYEAARQRRREFVAMMLRTRQRLEAFYAQDLPLAERRAGKARIFADLMHEYEALKASWNGYAGFDRYFDQGVNNALLASIATYSGKLPAFRTLLAKEGGDFPAFYREVKRLAALPKGERDAALQALEAQQAQDMQAADRQSAGR